MDLNLSGLRAAIRRRAKNLMELYNPRIWRERGLWWTSGVFLVTYLLVVLVLGIVWSRSPGEFDVRESALEMVGGDEARLVPGTLTTATAIRIVETLLDKPGGYLSNDVMPPGVYLDNIPSWEFGALTEVRDLVDSLRNHLSRAQSQSIEDVDLQIAQPQFNYNANSWILPSSESEYRKGADALYRYLERLSDERAQDGQFFARADNLTMYLGLVEKRLGSLAQRLSYAVGQRQLNTDLAGDPSARQSTAVPEERVQKTPWNQIDDVFFEARGYTWALLHTLQAIEGDFKSVLENKNALVSLRQIIRKLEETQSPIWSPLILNGTGFGPMANHSLVMASYISRANAAIIELRTLLEMG
ncbi:DUF2333 family protein [Marichromatium sp. AB32]|uniref:DUF2333 family protein n=2 Tax=Chromatiaceae TaxID=1046 RepID=A0A4R4A868_MARGR|nr:hypothetical protein [Marichromatium gracile]MBO8085293.1 DUF2333 family protein [Marichromatium sp.]RNE90252.1 DUF2333 family protein [Marichromatium sp. AB31]RNE93324.1 DUF2333 family protein [Marichromatium sp. AB32]TCW35071.1 hypothetical protein EDC29_10710 [Marichromatium gracile]